MKKILVIGGGAYQVPLIKRITEQGYEAYCVDGNPHAPGFSVATGYKHTDVTDREACLAYAQELRIDGVMTYGATITLPTVAHIGRQMGLPALPMATAEISQNKYQIKKRLAAAGLNIRGDFFEMHSPEEAKAHRFSLPCAVKPSDGSGSKGVSLVYDGAELDRAIYHAFQSARYGSFYVESLIPGEEYSVEAFVCHGQVYVYAVVKTTFASDGPDGAISYGHRTPSGLSVAQEQAIVTETKKAIRALDITMGSVNFDVILAGDDGRPYIIDCGIRVGQNLIASHLVPLSCGVDVMDASIRLALGEDVDATPKFQRCIATRLLIYPPGKIVAIKPVAELIGTNGIVDVVMRKQVGDIQKRYREKSDTCGWVITTGNTPDEAEANAVSAKERLKQYIVMEAIEDGNE